MWLTPESQQGQVRGDQLQAEILADQPDIEALLDAGMVPPELIDEIAQIVDEAGQ